MLDPSMARIRDLYMRSSLTLEEIGLRMGYEADTARKAAWRFLSRTEDPRISMLRRFSRAVGVTMEDLLK